MTQVDTSIHDKTTGRAAELAKQHEGHQMFESKPSTGPPQKLTIYGSWFCPFVQRVWLVLHEKSIPHEYREINPYRKEKRLLDLNPRGLVPTLEIEKPSKSVLLEYQTRVMELMSLNQKRLGKAVTNPPAMGPETASLVSESVAPEYQSLQEHGKQWNASQPMEPKSSDPASSAPRQLTAPSMPVLDLAQASQRNPAVPLDPEAANFKPLPHASTFRDKPKDTQKKGLYESSVILDYLDQAYALKLYPADAYDRALNKLWIDHISSRIVPAFYRFLQHTPDKAYTLQSACEEFAKHIYTFAEQLDETGPWFNGSHMMMVDVMLIPWACRIFLLDHYKGGSGIPEAGTGGGEGEEEVWGRWRRWFKAVEEKETVKDTLSDREKYIEVYQRYAEDTTNSMVGQATRAGRGLP